MPPLWVFVAALATTLAAPLGTNSTGNSTESCPTSTPATNFALSPCQTSYPASLHQLNSLYPNKTFDSGLFFIALRDYNDTVEQATELQFTGLPNNVSTCQLQLFLPGPADLHVYGTQPTLNFYQVERGVGEEASWETFQGAGYNTAGTPTSANRTIGNSTPSDNLLSEPYSLLYNYTSSPFSSTAASSKAASNSTLQSRNATFIGTVPGDAFSLETARTLTNLLIPKRGLQANNLTCNETMTFQVGMAVAGQQDGWGNSWWFRQVNVPATPVAGWRLVWGC